MLVSLPLILGLTHTASAAKLKTLYSFCAEANCTDGRDGASLIADSAGNLYGTTVSGGDGDMGTVFGLIGNRGKLRFRRIHSFCSAAACADGINPWGRLIIDTAGNLYGTAAGGGSDANVGNGVVFELLPNARHSAWKMRVLYTFCAQGGDCSDGSGPGQAGLTYAGAASGVPYDGTSPLYGTTNDGGAHGAGTVFMLVPRGNRAASHKVIYDFCPNDGCADGIDPNYGLTMDGAGNLYGTANGGTNFSGVVFALKPGSPGTKWKQSVLYTFGKYYTDDPVQPLGGLLRDAAGNLFGTTESGGGNDDYSETGGGTLFSLNGALQVLHSFCAQPACADGEYPEGNLTMDSQGTIYGVTPTGGTSQYGQGVIYRMEGNKFTVLHVFCSLADCADGGIPGDSVVFGPSGSLYGVTGEGGAHGSGTVFELTP